MSSFTNLPDELLLKITEEIKRGDIFLLRLVCKKFADVFAPLALSRVVVDVGTPRGGIENDPGMHALYTLSQIKNHPVGMLARTLHIKRFVPHTTVGMDEMNDTIQAAFRQLKGIKRLEWSWDYYPAQFGDAVAVALKPLCLLLRELEFAALRRSQLPILSGLSQLTDIHINTLSSESAYTTEIAALVERSRDTLEVLRLAVSPRSKGSFSETARDDPVEDNDHKELPLLRSLTLSADGWSVAFGSAQLSLPHLPSLQCLYLQPSLAARQNLPKVDSLFVALRESSVWLSKIASPATSSLVEYLDSYEDGGVRELEVHSGEQWTILPQAQNIALAEELFACVALKHSFYLEKLVLNAQYDNGWAFGNSNTASLLSPLPALRYLKLSLFIDSNPDPVEDHLRIFLDRMLRPSDFPVLQIIALDVLVQLPTSMGALPSIEHAIQCTRIALRRLASYRFRLPELGGKSKGIHDKELGSYMLPCVYIGDPCNYPVLTEELDWRYVREDKTRM